MGGCTSAVARAVPRAALALCGVSLGCMLTGCAGGSPAGAMSPTAPEPGQATAVAQREYGHLAGAGWGAAWDLWTPAAKRVISRAGYVHVNTVCPPVIGVPYVITGSRSMNATTVRVTYRHRGRTGTNTVRYIAGRWRFVPAPTLLHGLHHRPATVIAARKAADGCGRR